MVQVEIYEQEVNTGIAVILISEGTQKNLFSVYHR